VPLSCAESLWLSVSVPLTLSEATPRIWQGIALPDKKKRVTERLSLSAQLSGTAAKRADVQALHRTHVILIERKTRQGLALPLQLFIWAHQCSIAIPQGPSPALMVVITLSALVSMTETSFDRPLAV
jgi:hypothetical protein